MSDKALDELEILRQTIAAQSASMAGMNWLLRWLVAGMGVFLCGAFYIGSWVQKQHASSTQIAKELTSQRQTMTDQTNVVTALREEWLKVSGTRFTGDDWKRVSPPIFDAITNLDKRILTTEGDLRHMTKSLDRIEQKLGTSP